MRLRPNELEPKLADFSSSSGWRYIWRSTTPDTTDPKIGPPRQFNQLVVLLRQQKLLNIVGIHRWYFQFSRAYRGFQLILNAFLHLRKGLQNIAFAGISSSVPNDVPDSGRIATLTGETGKSNKLDQVFPQPCKRLNSGPLNIFLFNRCNCNSKTHRFFIESVCKIFSNLGKKICLGKRTLFVRTELTTEYFY